VRRETEKKRTANKGCLPCAPGKTHGKHRLFAVRLPKNARQTEPFAVRFPGKRTTMNGTFAVRLHKRTAKALFWLLVLVTLPCVFRKMHGKVTIAIYFFLVFTFKNTQKSQ
jgi:hypothetical protein